MGFAGRIFNKKQALERELKDLYLRCTTGAQVAATATANLTTDIVYTSVATGSARNTNTITTQVLAAAANPTDTVLVTFSGTAAAIVITVTPNDGTNNAATPVDLTTEELVELVNTGAVAGKTVTLTDASSLRALQTATGGDTTPLADAGEGDGVVATFANGSEANPTVVSGEGIASIVRNDVGDFTITLQDTYASFKYAKIMVLNATAVDLRAQLHSESVATPATKAVRFKTLTGATVTEPPTGTTFLVKLTLKNVGGW